MTGAVPRDDGRGWIPTDAAGRWLIGWTRFWAGRRWWLGAILILQAIVFSSFSAWIAWQPDVLQFFSANSAEVQNVRAASEKTGLVNQLRFDVHGTGNGADDQGAVADAVRALATALKGTGEFRSVWTGADLAEMAGRYGKLLSQAPLLLTAEQRAEVEGHATAEFLKARFAAVKGRLADPDGEFLAHQLAADPLDLNAILAGRLQALSPMKDSGGTSFHDGLLMRRAGGTGVQGWHAMIVTDPVSLPSNQKAAAKTLAAADAVVAALERNHPRIGVWIVGAHRGYVENAREIVRDVSRVSLPGTLAVALAIALFFRRVSTALLCMIPPVVGVGLALGIAGILHVALPLLLLGFAGLLCGSTTDYGIQMIAEARRLFGENGGAWHADIPAAAARRLLGPITMSVATSVAGFSALLLSGAPGLRAMGGFVAAATVSIWLVTFLVLPACLGPWILGRRRVAERNVEGARAGRSRWRLGAAVLCGVGFAVVTGWMIVGALHARFTVNPRALDGSPASLRADENAFSSVWGDPRNHAIVLVHGADAAAALTALTHVNDYMADQLRDGLIAHVTSPTGIVPDQATVERRAAAWAAYWTPEKRAQLGSDLAAAATTNGFKAAAFTPYAEHVGKMVPADAAERLAESPAQLFPGFIEQAKSGVTLASIVEMRSDVSMRRATAWGPELRARFPGTVVLSGNMLFFDATQRARSEGERLLPLCILAILLPLILYFRRLTRAWLAMLCLLVGLVWVLGAAHYFGGGLNMLSLVPVMFTLGVAVDYGIYASGRRSGERPQLGATVLCGVTTILGTGALLLAGHPAMRWLGITLVAGISGGILTAAFVVWPIGAWRRRRALVRQGSAERGAARMMRWAAWGVVNAALVLLTMALAVPVVADVVMDHEAPVGSEAVRTYPPLRQTGRRSFAIGDSSMHWRDAGDGTGMWEIRLVGDPFERGHAVAQLASPLDFRIETDMLDQLDLFLPAEWARWLILRGVGTNMVTLPRYVKPEYQQEIWASATGAPDPHGYLAPSYPRILSYHALHDISQMLIDNPLIVPNSFACTGVVSLPAFSAASGGHLYLARVFDFEGGESFARQKSVTYVVPPAGQGIPFVHVAWPGLAGCVSGINAQRVALFLNAAATNDHRRIGTPTILMARDILEHASNIAEAEKIIRETQVFVSDIVVVADGKTGQARVFEKSPGGTDFYDVDGSTAVTNHLVTPRFRNDPVNKERIADSTTLQRYTRARELLDAMRGEVTPERLVALLRDKKAVGGKDIGLGNRNAIDGLIACHGVVIDVTSGEMWVGAWPHVEGAFLHFSVQGGGADGPTIAADGIIKNGQWERWLKSTAAQNEGLAALRRNNLKEAGEDARAAIANNPNFYYGHEILGRVLMEKGETAAAEKELERALGLDPPYAKRRAEIEHLLEACRAGR